MIVRIYAQNSSVLIPQTTSIGTQIITCPTTKALKLYIYFYLQQILVVVPFADVILRPIFLPSTLHKTSKVLFFMHKHTSFCCFSSFTNKFDPFLTDFWACRRRKVVRVRNLSVIRVSV